MPIDEKSTNSNKSIYLLIFIVIFFIVLALFLYNRNFKSNDGTNKDQPIITNPPGVNSSGETQ